MALFAWKGRLRTATVVGWLACRYASVMARRAGTRLHTSVIEMRTRELDCVGMTYLARIVDDQMVGRHRDRIHPAAPGMTTGTVARRPLEHRTHVACDALQTQMGSGQGITCLTMGEILRIGLFGKDLHRSE